MRRPGTDISGVVIGVGAPNRTKDDRVGILTKDFSKRLELRELLTMLVTIFSLGQVSTEKPELAQRALLA